LSPAPLAATVHRVILGILSDTHGRADAAAEGMRVLRAAGATYFIHCGDVGSESVLDHLAGTQASFVFGNTDWDRRPLERYAQSIGVTCHGAAADLTLDGKRIAVVHGDDPRLKQHLLAGQEYDYLFQGHTHVPADERVGRTRVINPGALHRARVKTVATVDPARDAVQFLKVEA
jgi:putative phosphoesterase